jgi:hypothetical protein
MLACRKKAPHWVAGLSKTRSARVLEGARESPNLASVSAADGGVVGWNQRSTDILRRGCRTQRLDDRTTCPNPINNPEQPACSSDSDDSGRPYDT